MATTSDALVIRSTKVVSNSPHDSLVRIDSPFSGQIVSAGSALEVVISATALLDALVVTPHDIVAATGQPRKARIDIPATAIGEYPIAVIGTFAGEIGSSTATTTVEVIPNAAAVSLILSPAETFMKVGETEQITVRGVFDDGVSREMTGAAAVVYSSSNVAVAIAKPDGTLVAVGAGDAIITATAGDASGQAVVSVEAVPRRRAVAH